MLGGTLAAGGANAINMVVDRDIDAVMHRTRNRPLVTGVLQPTEALIFAIGLESVAFLFLWATVNLLSAVLAVSATLFYVFVYTLWLKRTSTHNIVIGGAAGAVPVLVGWSAVTNRLDWAPIVLFAVIFYWTPPHFWALAIKYRDDYAAADVPMLPGGRQPADHGHPDPPLHRAPVGADPRLRPGGRHGTPLPLVGDRARGGVHGARAPAPAQRHAGGGHAPVRLLDHLHHAAVRGHGRRPASALRAWEN